MTDLDSGRMDELAALLAVAREGTFVSAGRALQRHPTIVSRRIAALEARLGVRLLERTTRQVRLTEAGERFPITSAVMALLSRRRSSRVITALGSPVWPRFPSGG
jgi:hypothetical protein